MTTTLSSTLVPIWTKVAVDPITTLLAPRLSDAITPNRLTALAGRPGPLLLPRRFMPRTTVDSENARVS
jgi:hypothetical protein